MKSICLFCSHKPIKAANALAPDSPDSIIGSFLSGFAKAFIDFSDNLSDIDTQPIKLLDKVFHARDETDPQSRPAIFVDFLFLIETFFPKRIDSNKQLDE